MPTPASTALRVAWLAGATGLIGAALLARLRQNERYARVHVLARRPFPASAGDAKLHVEVVDFARLGAPLPPTDDVYIALGTTIKVAGSEAAFRQVDFDFVVNVARAGRAAGARRLAVVSALGADPASRVFYNRVKGEMQAAVAGLGFESVAIAQPSLLLGDRAALGQPERRLEAFAMRLGSPLQRLIPRAVRPIAAVDVAAALLHATSAATPGVHVLSSASMQAAARR